MVAFVILILKMSWKKEVSHLIHIGELFLIFRIGYYNDDYIEEKDYDKDLPNLPSEVQIEVRNFQIMRILLLTLKVFRDPNWIIKDENSKIYTAANTPMYDESLDELIRTIESYRACVREYPMLEPTFLIDAKWVFSFRFFIFC